MAASLEPFLRAIDDLLAHAAVQGWRVTVLGFSIPGTLDAAGRRLHVIPILPSLNGLPLYGLLEARYDLPIRLCVDVDAALLGEYHFGAGKDYQRLLYLTLNAVVGASFIMGGTVEQSVPACLGHVAHLSIAASGPRCSCGKRGCINTLISMDAMQKMVQRALRRGEETSLKQRLLNREYFSLQLLAEEAVRGDSVALQVYSEVGRWLGAATSRYISLFEPNILILGGGVLTASDLLLTQVRSALMTHSSSRVCSMVEVVPARLGSDAALVGAVVPLF